MHSKKSLLFLLALLLPLTVAANTQPVTPESTVAAIPNQAPRLAAKSWLLYDYTSRQVLLEENGHQRIEPASLTKLMTAYLTFAALRDKKITQDTKITPSALALRNEHADAKMFLSVNKPVTIEELLNGLVVISANDAARVLAETIGGSEAAFAEQMNREAQRLELEDSHFVNAGGQSDPLHYSSAHDLALLAAAIIRDFPEYLSLYSKKEIEYRQIKQYNRNRLLWLDPYVDGMKTAHSDSTGYSMVATANRNNHRIIAVVLGNTSENLRNSESQRLLNFGYQDFDLFTFYKPNEAITRIRIWKGTERELKVGLREGLTLTLPHGQREKLKASIETHQPLLAPISDNQQVGVLKLTLDDKPYMELPLVAVEPVALVNIFSRGIDSIRMMFSR